MHKNESRKAMLTRLEALSPESQRQWGTMTVDEMMVHCTDQIRGAINEKEVKIWAPLFWRTIGKWVTLAWPKVPVKNARTAKEYFAGKGMTPPVKFEDDKAELISCIERFIAQENNYAFGQHPLFGPMSQANWSRLIWQHLDHHFRQFAV